MISVILLTNDKPEYFIPMLESIQFRSANAKLIQLLVCDTGLSSQSLSLINKILVGFDSRSKIIKSKYHFSKNNNLLAKHAVYENLLFINNDVFLITQDFDLVINKFLSKNEVGSLGAKLLYANDTIQHSEVRLIHNGINRGLAYHPNRFHSSNFQFVNQTKEVDANTGAFLAVRKTNFNLVGGFDAEYKEEAQDVDLCFKLSELGLFNIYTNEIAAYHLENGTRELNSSCVSDRDYFRKKWDFFQVKKHAKYLNERGYKKRILIVRPGARGDVLALITLALLFKDENPSLAIDLMTDHVDIATSFNIFDNVLATGESYIEQDYLLVAHASYENETWQSSFMGWYEALAYSLGLRDLPQAEILYKRAASYINLRQQSISIANDLKDFGEYIVVSRGAGWPERQLKDELWVTELEAYSKLGLKIIELSSTQSLEKKLNIVDLVILDAPTDLLYLIIAGAKKVFLLDSYLLHVAALVDPLKIRAYTCKTTIKSVFGYQMIEEVRGAAKESPMAYCSKYGCRFKFGDGLANKCNKTLLNKGEFIEYSRN